ASSAPSASLRWIGPNARSLTVAVLQGNVNQDVPWDARYIAATMGRYSDLTREAVRRGAQLVVWPGTSLPGGLRDNHAIRRQVAELARETGVWLVIGSNDRDWRGEHEFNQAFLVNPGGALVGGYAKVRLVPFGEFVPMRGLFPILEKLHVRPFNLSPGPG